MNSDTLTVTSRVPPAVWDFLIVLGAVVLVSLIIIFTVVLFRKDGKRQRKHHHHHHHHRTSYREQLHKTTGGIKELIRQHRRRSHREHRSLNPTLAQTGGLPPVRPPENPSGPPPPAPQP